MVIMKFHNGAAARQVLERFCDLARRVKVEELNTKQQRSSAGTAYPGRPAIHITKREKHKMKARPFKDYKYKEQANVVKTRVNWIVGAVNAHTRKGRIEEQVGVRDYPGKVIRQLEMVIRKLRESKGK
jgi:hypothetical protein